MKIILFFITIISTLSFAQNWPATFFEEFENSPSSKKNKAVADFAESVISKRFTLTKSVTRIDGAAVVDVIIVDKLCHVTIDESSGEMLATKIDCY